MWNDETSSTPSKSFKAQRQKLNTRTKNKTPRAALPEEDQPAGVEAARKAEVAVAITAELVAIDPEAERVGGGPIRHCRAIVDGRMKTDGHFLREAHNS